MKSLPLNYYRPMSLLSNLAKVLEKVTNLEIYGKAQNYRSKSIWINEKGLNLNDILALLEEGSSDDDSNQTSHVDIVKMPPCNANGEVTDEDPDDEDHVRPSN
ncbi:hypothetical protein HHI36_017947 [Cryptolaemus montrouzieri]|uniref:Uncharacterized protein n=1 Tax=Cryptolaemus montrouzieri TaxID=559131 RepID=A0ABD2NYJ0_9CUCU